MVMNKEIEKNVPINLTFRVQIIRKDGEVFEKDFPKINQAIRMLWKARNVKEGWITIIHSVLGMKAQQYSRILVKIGRRRGISTQNSVGPLKDRPFLKINTSTDKFARLPNK